MKTVFRLHEIVPLDRVIVEQSNRWIELSLDRFIVGQSYRWIELQLDRTIVGQSYRCHMQFCLFLFLFSNNMKLIYGIQIETIKCLHTYTTYSTKYVPEFKIYFEIYNHSSCFNKDSATYLLGSSLLSSINNEGEELKHTVYVTLYIPF